MARQNIVDNYSKWVPGTRKGLYESYFLRGCAREKTLAFWIKYTVFCPAKRPGDAEGELWAIFFDGESGRNVAVKEVYPISQCTFGSDRFDVEVGDAALSDGVAAGRCMSGGNSISWDLSYPVVGRSSHFLPDWAYRAPFPKAKALSPYPDVTWTGSLVVNDEEVDVTGWKGSENHNWGVKHTDEYAWGQCNSFDGMEDTYAEMASARLKIGPIWTPYFTIFVLHYKGTDILFNSPSAIRKAHVEFPSRFEWKFRADNGRYSAEARLHASKETFAGLSYRNPPGGDHACLNSKIAACEIRLFEGGRLVDTLKTDHTAAFEVLTDETDHGVEILV